MPLLAMRPVGSDISTFWLLGVGGDEEDGPALGLVEYDALRYSLNLNILAPGAVLLGEVSGNVQWASRW